MSTKFLFIESMEIFSTIPQYHVLLQTFIVLWLVWFVAKRRYNTRETTLTDEEVERKLAEWHPEPLIPDVNTNHVSLRPKRVTSRVGKRITVDGRDCLNLGTQNYLGLVENKEIEEKAIAAVGKYGVGSCGPRGFYGTVDVHLELEERLAKFTDTEEAVVYSYGFSTIASSVSAFCKRKDLVFADESINFAIQKGLDASRANVKYFKHNDVTHLQELLEEQAAKDRKNPKAAAKTKRFLIVEGIYVNTGSICPLPELVRLCRQHKLRIFVDESVSFGTLGASGKGVTEYYDVPRHEIDMIIGSLESAIGSVGGFCVGTTYVIEHHRLSGLGYCFSASLPPLLSSAAITSLDIMERSPEMFKNLKDNCLAMDEGLKRMEHLETHSFSESPLKHVYLKKKLDRDTEQKILSTISEKCIENNVAIITPVYLEAERSLPRPSLRICVTTLLTKSDIDLALNTLKMCADEVLAARSTKPMMCVRYDCRNDPEAWQVKPSPHECKPPWTFPEKRPFITYSSTATVVPTSNLNEVAFDLTYVIPERSFVLQGTEKWYKRGPDCCPQPSCLAPQCSTQSD